MVWKQYFALHHPAPRILPKWIQSTGVNKAPIYINVPLDLHTTRQCRVAPSASKRSAPSCVKFRPQAFSETLAAKNCELE